MYAAYFGLSKLPFTMTPDSRTLFLTAQHREAVAGLAYAILNRKGLLVLSGEVGTGKTTVLARVLNFLPPERVNLSIVRHPTLTPDEFIEMVMLDFGITPIPQSKAQRLLLLKEFLLDSQAKGRTAALIIDEAHKLSREVMEEVRLLGNFDSGDQKLLQIVMAGQSELDELLRREDLRQLKQRVAVRVTLEPLPPPEVESYIAYRWAQAGGNPEHPFSAAAIRDIYRWSRGIPRLINSICDNTLLLAFAEQKTIVEADHVHHVAADLDLAMAASGEASKMPLPVMPTPLVPPAAPASQLAAAAPLMAKIHEIRVPEFCGGAPERSSLWYRCAAKLGLA
jgi:general secretion pathway protein A